MQKETELILTIDLVIKKYLDTVRFRRSEHTRRAYKNALNVFRRVLFEQLLDPHTTPIEKLTERIAALFVVYLNDLAPATEKLYVQAIKSFYEYVNAEGFADINVSRLRNLIRQSSRHSRIHLPKLATDDIERLLEFISDAQNMLTASEAKEKLRAMRDRAFLLTLADTGLRVHEACELLCSDVDWERGTLIIGKGDKQAVVRFSTRAMKSLKDYLSLRAPLDGGSGRPLPSLPLFARHDKGAGKKIKPVTTTTGRNIVIDRVREILGEDSVGRITPHSFRHYFVTTVLRGSGNLNTRTGTRTAQQHPGHATLRPSQR